MRPAAAPAEPASGRSPLSERGLAFLWHGQRFPPGVLVTTAGECLAVIFRGRPGLGPGPDYRDAILALPDGRLLHGDVELHLRASDYLHHGHSGDPNYRRVILHLVVEDDLLLPAALPLRTIALAPWLQERERELAGWLQRPPLWQEPCRDAVERQGERHVAAILRRTGFRRFEEHVYAARRDLERLGAEAALLAALFDGLGFSQNRQPFRTLAHLLPGLSWQLPQLEADLFAAAGFLEDRPDPYTRELAYTARLRPLPGLGWRLWGLRPENHPQRRLAGGVRLLPAFGSPAALLSSLAATLEQGAEALRQALVAPAEGYWAEHLLPGQAGAGPALIGPVRAAEIGVNGVLPFFVAFGETQGNDALAAAARSLYAAFPPGADYGITRPVARALRGARGPLARTAADQQGLLYLFKHYCSRGRCLECPFAES